MVSGFIYTFFKNLNKLTLPTIYNSDADKKKVF